METKTFSEARRNFAATMDQVVENHEPVLITRQNHEAVVMISLSNFNSYEETFHLLRSRTNARRLNRAIESLESGGGIERELLET